MKLYDEKEIGSILKRAAELSHNDAGSDSLGLSLEELQQLGKEAGINPDFILKAATEIGAQKSRSEGKNFYGGPVSYSSELVLEGEITASDWEEMLVKVRDCFKDPGIVSTRENTFEWTIQSREQKAQVTARLENGKTKIHLFWAAPVAPVPFFIPTLVGTLISIPIIFEALNLSGFPGALAIMSTMATLFSLGRWGVSSYADRFSSKLDRLMTVLELIAVRGSEKKLRAVQQHRAKAKSSAKDDHASPELASTSADSRLDLEDESEDGDDLNQQARPRERGRA